MMHEQSKRHAVNMDKIHALVGLSKKLWEKQR